MFHYHAFGYAVYSVLLSIDSRCLLLCRTVINSKSLRLQITQYFVYDPNNDAKLLTFLKENLNYREGVLFCRNVISLGTGIPHKRSSYGFNIHMISLWLRMEQLNWPPIISLRNRKLKE